MKTARRVRHLLLTFLLIAGILAGLAALLVNGRRQYLFAAYPLAYADFIDQYSHDYGITPSLICAVICTESHFQPEAVSHADAIGLMQLTAETFSWAQMRAGVREPMDQTALTDPQTNIRFGVYTLQLLYESFSDEDAVLAAYNAGQGQVRNWLADPRYSADGVHLDTIPFAETAAYVKQVKKAQTIYRDLYHID